jgi:sugar lactone lactonase YvrE
MQKRYDTLYATDSGNNRIRKISENRVSTLAGSTEGNNDGMGSEARFREPTNLVADSSGNLYVTDFGNDAIRKISPNGEVTTLPGKFDKPFGITRDPLGNLYVSEVGPGKTDIKKIDINTLQATSLLKGHPNGHTFRQPSGLVFDPKDGGLFISDENTNMIYKLLPDQRIIHIAGSGEEGLVDRPKYADDAGNILHANFAGPIDMTLDGENLYVVDYRTGAIRRLYPDTTTIKVPGTRN